MEITCSQCTTVFLVDVGLAVDEEIEVVCPGCFYLHAVRIPALELRREEKVERRAPELRPGSPLGEGGVAERLRDGFTLTFEVRHPARPEPLRLNPFVIRQKIYAGELDGQEEFRENQGRWFPIGEHPEFMRVFQILGKSVRSMGDEPVQGNQRRFAGWKGAEPAREAPVVEAISPLEPRAALPPSKSSLSPEPPPKTPVKAQKDLREAPLEQTKSRAWTWGLLAGVGAALVLGAVGLWYFWQ